MRYEYDQFVSLDQKTHRYSILLRCEYNLRRTSLGSRTQYRMLHRRLICTQYGVPYRQIFQLLQHRLCHPQELLSQRVDSDVVR